MHNASGEPTTEPRKRGRPRRADALADVREEFHVTRAEREALDRLARAERKPRAALIRDAVNAYVADAGDDPVFRDARPVSSGSKSEHVRN